MRYTIQNTEIEAQVLRKGAELCSVRCKSTDREYIWQAEQAWPRHAPNLFPIVGSLIEHQYILNGQTYDLSHHGFARDMDFDVLQQSQHSISFVLAETDETLKAYPFAFRFVITYTLDGRNLEQKFRVINQNNEEMPVSFGAHPAFNANPIEGHYLEFDKDDEFAYLMETPLISRKKRSVVKNKKLQLSKTVFNDDALIFIKPKSSKIILKNSDENRLVSMDFVNWPYLGIWAKPAAHYVCVEPWEGLADLIGHNKQLREKEGIIWIKANESYQNKLTMTFHKL